MNLVFKNFLKNVFILTSIMFSFVVQASQTDGIIDNTYNSALLCVDNLCTTTTRINFKPTLGTAIHITDTAITGNAWSETFGWINLNPTTFGGVTNTTNGVLGGYAWGDGAGWINFAPTLGGVTINSTGQFIGYSWSENYGWIKFDCNVLNACVTTDWRPISVRPSDSSHGSSGFWPIKIQIIPTDTTVVVPVINPFPIITPTIKKPKPVLKKIIPQLEEEIYIDQQPKFPPKIDNSKNLNNNQTKTVYENQNISKSIIEKINDFLIKIIGYIKSAFNYIFGDYLTLVYDIFGYKGSILLNKLIGYVLGIILGIFILIYFERKKKNKSKL